DSPNAGSSGSYRCWATSSYSATTRSGDRLERSLKTTGVTLLGAGERLEPLRDLLEAFVASGPREAGVHLGVLVRLAGDRGFEVVRAAADRDVGHGVADLGEEVEVPERMAGLAFGDGAEERGHVGVTFHIGLLRK